MSEIQNIIAEAIHRDPHEPEFIQALEEVAVSLEPVLTKHPEYKDVFRRLIEPERIIIFRVPWVDDKGTLHVNRGYRVQFNSALGPYKGGLRFHPSVNLSVVKFLGFEQIFKNSLTTLPLGAAKGGSDFNPKGKSDNEVMRFCQSFMTELYRHIGPNTDVPAGDIGVGGREIGFLFGQYKRLRSEFSGVLTGKALEFGGSLIRPEATGYGVVYFGQEIMKGNNDTLEGKRVLVSGSGNVAQFCVEKLIHMGAKPITMSDSGGYILEKDGFTAEQLKFIMDLKNNKRGRIKQYLEFSKSAEYFPGKKPWDQAADVAMPCATQNEILVDDAKQLVANGIQCVVEGANMPSTNDAVHHYLENNILYGPAKAANAGGVAVSGLEMAQNSIRMGWSRENVDEKLQAIMAEIYGTAAKTAEQFGKKGNLQLGANAAGFLKLARAMKAQGVV